MDAVASVAVVDVAGGGYGWSWPILVGGDIAPAAGPVLTCGRRRLLRLWAQILAELVASDLVVELSEESPTLADFLAVARDRQGMGMDRRGRVDLRRACW